MLWNRWPGAGRGRSGEPVARHASRPFLGPEVLPLPCRRTSTCYSQGGASQKGSEVMAFRKSRIGVADFSGYLAPD